MAVRKAAKWKQRLIKILEIPVGLIVLGMMVLVSVNAVGRRLFGFQIPGTLEVSQYLFLPLVAVIGIFIAQLRGEHVVADLFYSRFSNAVKKVLTVGTLILVAFVMGAFGWFGFEEALDAMQKGVHAGTTDIPAWPAYFTTPLALGGMMIICAVEAWRTVRTPVTEFTTDLEEEAAVEFALHVPGIDDEEVASVEQR